MIRYLVVVAVILSACTHTVRYSVGPLPNKVLLEMHDRKVVCKNCNKIAAWEYQGYSKNGKYSYKVHCNYCDYISQEKWYEPNSSSL